MSAEEKPNGPTLANNLTEVKGSRQSPVNIDLRSIQQLEPTAGPLQITYPSLLASAVLSNTGHGWQVTVPVEGDNKEPLKWEVSGGPLQHKYRLQQFHMHWGQTPSQGSEHTINGKSYAGELHLVHWNTDLYSSYKEASVREKGLVVVALFLEVGGSHSEFSNLCSFFTQISNQGDKVKIPGLDIRSLLPQNPTYWTYEGSLTTPPYAESVTWLIFREPIVVHENDLEQCRKLLRTTSSGTEEPVKENFRAPQHLHGRVIRQASHVVLS